MKRPYYSLFEMPTSQKSASGPELKLRPHLEHANYYRYLLFLMNRDLGDDEWREFEGMVADVAVTGEAPLQLSNRHDSC